MLPAARKITRPMWLLLGLYAAAFAASGCELKAPKLGASHPDGGTDTTKLDARAALRSLFPSLSDTELSDVSGKLSLRDAAALRTELSEVRKSVAKLSEELFKTAEQRVSERTDALRDHNEGYPEAVAALGELCSYHAADKRAELQLSGGFKEHTAVQLQHRQLQLRA